MKIGLNQPNGFPNLFAPDSTKYVDLQNPSIAVYTQRSNTGKRVASIHIP